MAYYKKEVEENEARLACMKRENRDPYDIKKFEEVLGESYMMVPDSETRLTKSLEDLAHCLKETATTTVTTTTATATSNDDKSEWEVTARELLEQNLSTYSSNTKDAVGDQEYLNETDVKDLKDDEAF